MYLAFSSVRMEASLTMFCFQEQIRKGANYKSSLLFSFSLTPHRTNPLFFAKTPKREIPKSKRNCLFAIKQKKASNDNKLKG